MTLFRNKYRIQSSRLNGWNYSSTGCYFLTICTFNKECSLGFIRNGKAELSTLGRIAETEILRSFVMRNELTCFQYVIMPNHIHLIVGISRNAENHKIIGSDTSTLAGQSISSFLCGFKSAVTCQINSFRSSPGKRVWQPRFYDHLIRNVVEFENISAYVANNPRIWKKDRFYTSETDNDLYPV